MLLAVDEYHPGLSKHHLLLPQDICLEKTSIVKEKQKRVLFIRYFFFIAKVFSPFWADIKEGRGEKKYK